MLPALDDDPTRRAHAVAERLLDRHGVVTRGAVVSERVPGGFAAVYKVLSAFEETGRCRRGYFVGTPRRRPVRHVRRRRPAAHLRRGARRRQAGRDRPGRHRPGQPLRRRPALARPTRASRGRGTGHRPGRKAGAMVVLVDGALTLYVERGGSTLLTWPDDARPCSSPAAARARRGRPPRRARPDDRREGRRRAAARLRRHAAARGAQAAGFVATPRGLRLRRRSRGARGRRRLAHGPAAAPGAVRPRR